MCETLFVLTVFSALPVTYRMFSRWYR